MQDFLTSSYLLTSKDCFYTRAQMGQLICQMGDALSRVELPQPALLKPMELWTGKQVFSMLVRPSSQARYDFPRVKHNCLHEHCRWLFSLSGCGCHGPGVIALHMASTMPTTPAESALLLLTRPCPLCGSYVALQSASVCQPVCRNFHMPRLKSG